MKVLVTGGAGYIGSHTCLQLLQAGHKVLVVDNFCNSHHQALKRVQQLAGRELLCIELDLLDRAALTVLFGEHDIDAVVHFAGLKAVGESVSQPLRYYQNNLQGTMNLLEVMADHEVWQMVFSSSATVYGDPVAVPIREDFALSATNPYGWTKLMIEQILCDLALSDSRWRLALLRYFNPVGAHESGQIGEDPEGIPNNLMPYITQVAAGRLEKLSIFGNDYPTKDGTGVRDYIHVVDLASGHLAALDYLQDHVGARAFNLGTGCGYSVLDMVAAFERVTGKPVPYEIVDRRPGDIASCYADPGRARDELNWRAEKGIDDMVRDAWRWQSQNPSGYR